MENGKPQLAPDYTRKNMDKREFRSNCKFNSILVRCLFRVISSFYWFYILQYTGPDDPLPSSVFNPNPQKVFDLDAR